MLERSTDLFRQLCGIGLAQRGCEDWPGRFLLIESYEVKRSTTDFTDDTEMGR